MREDSYIISYLPQKLRRWRQQRPWFTSSIVIAKLRSKLIHFRVNLPVFIAGGCIIIFTHKVWWHLYAYPLALNAMYDEFNHWSRTRPSLLYKGLTSPLLRSGRSSDGRFSFSQVQVDDRIFSFSIAIDQSDSRLGCFRYVWLNGTIYGEVNLSGKWVDPQWCAQLKIMPTPPKHWEYESIRQW